MFKPCIVFFQRDVPRRRRSKRTFDSLFRFPCSPTPGFQVRPIPNRCRRSMTYLFPANSLFEPAAGLIHFLTPFLASYSGYVSSGIFPRPAPGGLFGILLLQVLVFRAAEKYKRARHPRPRRSRRGSPTTSASPHVLAADVHLDSSFPFPFSLPYTSDGVVQHFFPNTVLPPPELSSLVNRPRRPDLS